ncbi:MAG: metal-dependent hydrolase [Myxococcota bacterium]
MAIQPRRMNFDFDPDQIPRDWCCGIPLLSHAVNGMNLIFPEGERFFIRAVRHHLGQIDDPELRSQAKAFFIQEAHHGRAHAQAFEMLESQGHDLTDWLAWYTDWIARLERWLPPVLRLAATAALEHLTASLAHFAMTSGLLEGSHPVMRDLLEWHSLEEMEHKAVAFDILAAVDGRWWVRVAGMGIGLMMFLVFWMSGVRLLLRQDPQFKRSHLKPQRAQLRARLSIRDGRLLVTRYALPYLRRGFHPDQIDDSALQAQALSRLMARYPGEAAG